MKEDFLHYVWQFKKFEATSLRTTRGETLMIVNSGQYLQQAGPDFFNARILIGEQKWAGNIEIHVKSSDWYIHHHENDTAYDSVILHVVWEHDTEVYRRDNTEIAVLELKHYVPKNVLDSYRALVSAKSWINCEKEIHTIDSFIQHNWRERLFFERLERKAMPILEFAQQTSSDWEAVLFAFLARNFGLNINGESFFKIAQSLPFPMVRKESFEQENIEALLFGRAGLLEGDNEDVYYKDLKARYRYMLVKHRLEEAHIAPIQFFRHRPDNFPTIRLAQLAQLYHRHQNLFSKIISCTSPQELYDIFAVGVSPYWQQHYRFDRESPKRSKMLTNSFIDLIIINTIVPLQFAYARSSGKESSEMLIGLLSGIAPEKNAVIDKFRQFKVVPVSAFETQALLQLRNEYCAGNKCLQCAIGTELLKN